MSDLPKVSRDCKYFSSDMWYRFRSPCAVHPDCDKCNGCKDYEPTEQKKSSRNSVVERFFQHLGSVLGTPQERLNAQWGLDMRPNPMNVRPDVRIPYPRRTDRTQDMNLFRPFEYQHEFIRMSYDTVSPLQQEELNRMFTEYMETHHYETRWPEIDQILRRRTQERLLRSHLRTQYTFPDPDAHLDEILERAMAWALQYEERLNLTSNVRVFLINGNRVEFIVFTSDAGERYTVPKLYTVPRNFVDSVDMTISEEFLYRHGTPFTVHL